MKQSANHPMSRYAMSLSTLRPLPSDVDAAEATAVGMGAKIVRKAAGAMLIEATPTVVAKLTRALPRWRVHPEGGSARVPERRPLERAKLAANAKWARSTQLPASLHRR